jgi:hypothetical protein
VKSVSVKSFLLFSVLCPFGLSIAHSQTLFAPSSTVGASGNGNVGIGTAFPAQKLTIQGGHGDTQFRMFSDNYGQGIDGANTALLSLWASEPGSTWGGVGIGNNVTNSGGIARVTNSRGGSYIRLLDNTMYLNVVDGAGTDRNGITINSGGNVGIGTSTPAEKLHVIGNALLNGSLLLRGGGHLVVQFRNSDSAMDQRFSEIAESSGVITFRTLNDSYTEASDWLRVFRSTGSYNIDRITFPSSANVGIGTTNPAHKLAVNGTIKAKEVIVETTGWSDYVFADDYALAPLTEVEAHIKEHKHLPGIPSAAQVAEQGVSVGEMQAKLLAKIEELTLHQIQQEKRLAAQGLRIETLERENTRLQTRR